MSKSLEEERNSIIELLELHKVDYLMYRGSSFSQITGELLWAKDDALAYAEGIDSAIAIIKARGDK